MKIYLAGPMRGRECFNFPEFSRVAEKLRKAGHEVVSPHEMDKEKFGWDDCPTDIQNSGFTIEDALRRDYDAIVDVQAVVLMPGWENSAGANFEKMTALAIGREVFYYEEDPRPGSYPGFILRRNDPKQKTGAERYFDKKLEDPEYKAAYDSVDINGGEKRITSETGGQKGQKQAQLGAVDALALEQLALVAGFGGEKYDRYNFLKGYPWSLSIDALFRHLLAFIRGEDTDPESGLPHTTDVAWHGLALTSFLKRNIGKDDRFNG